MTSHTKFSNPKELQDAGEINDWLQKKIAGIKDKSIGVSIHKDGTVKEIEIGKKLTAAEKKLITDKFPELENKEIE